MDIGSINREDIPQLYDFFQLSHSDSRKDDIESYINYWMKKTPDAINYISVQKDGNELVGLNILSPMEYFFNGEKKYSQWAFDLYVKEEYRKKNWGSYLMLYVKTNYPTHFATGSGPWAMKLLTKLKATQIGQIHKYVGVSNPVLIFSSICRGVVPFKRFPYSLNIDGNTFILTNSENLPEIITPYNDDILEINHDLNFLRWKFFKSYHNYAFYLDKQSKNFIVFRTIVKKHITMLMIVDYRCNVHSEKEVDVLCRVAIYVARKIRVAFIYCGSSMSCIDKVFERYHFKAIGRHRPIITYDKTYKDIDLKSKIDDRDFILVTLADSDGEPI